MAHRVHTRKTGAALLIAVAILAILTVFAVVFSLQSRVDMDAASNFSNNVRADLIADGATAIAIAFLEHNRNQHPHITSLDQAAFTYFNGTWIAGKQWAFLGNTWAQGGILQPFISADQAEVLGEDLYIPRVATTFSATPDLTLPFLLIDPDPDPLSDFKRTRAEQLHQLSDVNGQPSGILFTDVDNNGDGLRDSMWIPIPADRIFGGVDQDGDGETDGLDNDGDGFIDEAGETNISVDEGGDGIDNDLDGQIDEAGEIAHFVYWGGNDNLDNDRDGFVDDLNEQRIYLTAPLVITNPINANFGSVLLANGFLVNVNVNVLVEYADASAPSDFAANWQSIEYAADIDSIDNDYDFITNNDAGDTADPAATDLNGDGFIDALDNFFAIRQLGLNPINIDSTDPASYSSSAAFPSLLTAARGEPVCNIAGRAAVLITDESSKVNIDVAGAYKPNEHYRSLERFSYDARRPTRRALSQGVGTHEYDPRVLPNVGAIRAGRMFDYRMGITNGQGFGPVPGLSDKLPAVANPEYADISAPGYGGVDDNMSSLWMAVNGIDDDGDAEIYQNDNVDNDLNGLIDEAGEGALVGIDEGLRQYDYDGDGLVEYANFEGTDEPGEYQLFRPLRNRVLELTPGDEDEDASFEEFGEASDRYYHARDQLLDVNGIGATIYDRMRNFVTAHSLDGGGRYQYFSRVDGSFLEQPLLNGLKLNLNYSMAVNPNNADDPGQLARVLFEDWYYAPSTADRHSLDLRELVTVFGGDGRLGALPYYFLSGLRQEDVVTVGVPFYATGTSVGATPDELGAMPADQEIRALRLGASMQDFRDRDHVRTESSMRIADPWWDGSILGAAAIDDIDSDGIQDFIRQIEYKTSGIESIRINEIMVRPTRRIEAEGTPGSLDTLDPNQFLTGEFDYDADLTGTWAPAGNVGVIGEDTVLSSAVNNEIVQFRFRPSVGLPPGRYYLLVNLTDEFGDPTASSLAPGDIEYAIKYLASTDGLWPGDAAAGAYPAGAQRSHGDTDIITDDGSIAVPWRPLAATDFQVLPLTPVDRDTGMAFLGSDVEPTAVAPPFEGYTQGSAFTVEIPPFQGGPNGEQVELVVALRRVSGGPGFSVNYFEFSQDPDHEYIEIVNIEEPPENLNADNLALYAIDLSGWEIEVGDSNTDSNAAIMAIPDDTLIAPGDSVLLAVNKFDIGIDGNGRTLFNDTTLEFAADIFKNGIGLARGPRIPAPTLNALEPTYGFGWVTEPPIPRIDDTESAARGYNVPQDYAASGSEGNDTSPPTGVIDRGSVFFRPVDRELVDIDGDGTDDYGAAGPEPDPNFYRSTAGNESGFGGYNPTAFADVAQDDTNPAKAWDRIVQLEIANDDVLFASESRADIAALVLRGGIFPNYPEADGVDNDGDDGFLSSDNLDNDGDRDPNAAFDDDNDALLNDIELLGDGIDNDNDGFIDEPVNSGHGADEAFEGYDEGYVRRYVRGATGLPLSAVPGGYDDIVVPFTDIFSPNAAINQPDYVSNLNEAPDWKAFVERRFYPGDNVIVTLYDGPVGGGRVVDRVTYNQRDVENVAIDDDVDVPAGLEYNVNLTQAWPPNTMGLDFYRSLERKHPLYAGDRYGTRNRWTATDGNYDDWSRGTNRFDELITGSSPQFLNTDENDALVNHGLSGSPLRMNFYQRVLENNNNQFAGAGFVAPGGFLPHQWAFDRAKVRNRNVASAGDLLTLSHLSFVHNLYSVGGAFDTSFELTPYRTANARARMNTVDLNIYGPLIGMDSPKDVQALLTSTSFDEVNLSVGQADFYPLYPTASIVTGDPDLVRWSEVGGVPVAPRAWTPVFLYPLGGEVGAFTDDFSIPVGNVAQDPTTGTEQPFSHLYATAAGNYPFLEYFMFQPALDIGKVPAGVLDSDMEERWPIDRRAVAYVSANTTDFNPNFSDHNAVTPNAFDVEHPAEALFVWQAEDGLQNGRYDAYVVTMDNLDDVLAAHEESGQTLLTQVGETTADAIGLLNPEDFGVDIAFFTDANGDRRCWEDQPAGNPGLPDMNPGGSGIPELSFDANNLESFGRFDGVVPSREGIIYYGAVEVKNNYLALFVRNWATGRAANRVTRVVLTPRRATSGRININTAVTQPVNNGELFNPLLGIPGMLANNTGSTFPDNDFAFDLPNGYANTAADGFATLVRSDNVIAGRQERGVDTSFYAAGRRDFDTPYALLGSQNAGTSSIGAQFLQYPYSIYYGAVSTLAPGAAPGEARFNEMQARMSLMSNFVTTRSDVFEISVTAQPGYVADNNGDGVLNWRDDGEFVPTGEVKRRIIYERAQGDPDAARQ